MRRPLVWAMALAVVAAGSSRAAEAAAVETTVSRLQQAFSNYTPCMIDNHRGHNSIFAKFHSPSSTNSLSLAVILWRCFCALTRDRLLQCESCTSVLTGDTTIYGYGVCMAVLAFHGTWQLITRAVRPPDVRPG